MAGVKGRSGGARVGAGRKKRTDAARALAGGRKRPSSPVVLSPVTSGEPIACPSGVGDDEAAVWRLFAPLAHRQGTLVAEFAPAFLQFCRNVVLEEQLSKTAMKAGPDHRGMLRIVELGMARFRLIPDGKPVVVEQPKDEWADFDAPTLTLVKR